MKEEADKIIIMDDDELEDGSIFVCFLCEKEFKKVSLLNDHMKSHADVPELSHDFPPRARGGSVRGPRGQSKGQGQISRGRGRGRSFQHVSPDPVLHRLDGFPKPMPNSVITPSPKGEESVPVHRPRGRPRLNGSRVRKVKVPVSSFISPHMIKKEPGEFTPVQLRPMVEKAGNSGPVSKIDRLRNYFQRLAKEAPPTPGRKRSLEDDEEDEDFDDPTDDFVTDEEMMMISPHTSTISCHGGAGKTDSKSFISPIQHRDTQDSEVGKKRHIKIRKKIIVKEILYEEVEGESDENDEQEINESLVKAYDQRRYSDEELDDFLSGDQYGEVIVYPNDGRHDTARSEGENRALPGRRSQPRRQSQKSEFICMECSSEYSSMTTLRVHMKSHQEVRELSCPFCEEVFPQRHILHQHLLDAHEESCNLTCPACNKVFTRTDSLRSHMVRMHGQDGGLDCRVCGKNFPSQGQLEMHMRVHTGERPFVCHLCDKGFVQKVHLRTHLRTIHNLQEIQSTPCRLCDAMVDGRAGLKEHFYSAHGMTTQEYKNQVAKLRKEGIIPEVPPPVVKEVDPSLNYYKVNLSQIQDVPNRPRGTRRLVLMNGVPRSRRGRGRRGGNSKFWKKVMGRRRGSNRRKRSVTPEDDDDDDEDDQDGYEENGVSVSQGAEPRRRDQEELSIVESAFKVAEEMEQMREEMERGEGRGQMLHSIMSADEEDGGTTGVYYAVPLVMSDGGSTSRTLNVAEALSGSSNCLSVNNHRRTDRESFPEEELEDDEEYAAFAAEHEYQGGEGVEEEASRGAAVKLEPITVTCDSNSESVEIFNM